METVDYTDLQANQEAGFSESISGERCATL